MLKALITFVCGLGALSLLYGVKKKKNGIRNRAHKIESELS